MKVLGGVPGWNYRNVGHANLAAHYISAVRYALSLPRVANAVMGLCTPDELHQAIDAVLAFAPLSETELTSLLAAGAEIAPTWGHHYGPVGPGTGTAGER
jgi:hypothetical protein